MANFLHIGGLVAVGFDASGSFLLAISHSGRGVYRTDTWERIARDCRLAYPVDGAGMGIGPIAGLKIPVTEMDYDTGEFYLVSPNGKVRLECESSGIAVQMSFGGPLK